MAVTVDVGDQNDNDPRFDEQTFLIAIREDATVNDSVPVSTAIRAEDADSISEGNLRYFILHYYQLWCVVSAVLLLHCSCIVLHFLIMTNLYS